MWSMKIPLITVGALIFVVALIVIIGSLLPSHHIVARSALFHASPEKLFALISGSQSWRPDLLQSSETTDAAGRRFVEETTRHKEVITYELLDIEPPISIKRRIASQNLPYSGTWSFTLQPSGQDTLVRITEDGEVSNPIFRFVSRFILGHTSTLDNYLRSLGKATGQEVQLQN